jgi:hypothetical protein
MSKQLILPPELDDARDAAIEQAWSGQPLPIDFDLTQWLEGDGWSAMMDIWDDCVAYSLGELSWSFSDAELRDWEGVDEDDVITDAMRLKYARERIDGTTDGSNTEAGCSVHVVPLTRADGKSAVVGCTVHSEGQAGWRVEWKGAFPTRTDFERYLRASDVATMQEAIGLDDAVILGLWQQPANLRRDLDGEDSEADEPDAGPAVEASEPDISPVPHAPGAGAAVTPHDRLAQLIRTMRLLNGSKLLADERRVNASAAVEVLEALQAALEAPTIDLDAIDQALKKHGMRVAMETNSGGYWFMLRRDLADDVRTVHTLLARLMTAQGRLVRVLSAFEKLRLGS